MSETAGWMLCDAWGVLATCREPALLVDLAESLGRKCMVIPVTDEVFHLATTWAIRRDELREAGAIGAAGTADAT